MIEIHFEYFTFGIGELEHLGAALIPKGPDEIAALVCLLDNGRNNSDIALNERLRTSHA